MKSGLKPQNHHSHNCNYCINTKQHRGDAQIHEWPDWNTKGYSTQWQRNTRCKHSQQRSHDNSFFSFLALVFFFLLQSSNNMTTNRRCRQVNERVLWLTNKLQEGKKNGDKEGKRHKSESCVNDDSAPMLTCPKLNQKKAPDFRHPDEVIKKKKNAQSR